MSVREGQRLGANLHVGHPKKDAGDVNLKIERNQRVVGELPPSKLTPSVAVTSERNGCAPNGDQCMCTRQDAQDRGGGEEAKGRPHRVGGRREDGAGAGIRTAVVLSIIVPSTYEVADICGNPCNIICSFDSDLKVKCLPFGIHEPNQSACKGHR